MSLLSTNTLAPWFRPDSWPLNDPLLDVLDELVHATSNNPPSASNTRKASKRQIYKPISPLMALDLIETEKEFQVHCDLPGVEKENLDINVTDGFLVLKAERKSIHEDNKHTVHSLERPFGKVQRKLALPPTVDADKVNASFKNGVLTVSFPKKPEATTQKIAIKFD